MADIHALMYAMDADLLLAVYVVVAFLVSVAIFCQLLKLAWSYLEPLVFMAIGIGDLLIEDVKDWWSDRQDRKQRRMRDATQARNFQLRASMARTAGREDRRDVSARLRSDVAQRRAQADSIRRAQNWANHTQPDAAARARAQGHGTQSTPQGGLDPRSAA